MNEQITIYDVVDCFLKRITDGPDKIPRSQFERKALILMDSEDVSDKQANVLLRLIVASNLLDFCDSIPIKHKYKDAIDMDRNLQRMLEEIIYEKHDENKQLKKKIAELEKQYSDCGILQISSANELFEQERKKNRRANFEIRQLLRHIEELEGQLAELRRVFGEKEKNFYEALAAEQAEREHREKQVAELKGRLAKMRRVVDEEFP